ncbi:MAG: UDP-2,3-diacylglucosamine diphosphatase [Candidatus Aminicenantes bacterium]|nr:UDP-2,3-diacylglucosamine diphosphatase [Candidatus Aminicenantes bacterium]
MKNTYFISDIHLSFNDGEMEQKKRINLHGFLDFIQRDAKELFILGDLFDFWFEWYHVIPKYWFPVLHHFKKLIDSGITINLIKGNHDFYPGKYLQKEVGIQCHDESHIFSIGNKKFFISHGDGLAKKDRGYRILKKIIRNPLSIFFYKTFISADLGIKLAKWTAHSNRTLIGKKKNYWSEEYFQFARDKFEEGFDYVILGHLHVPTIRKEKDHIYVNCGDWISEFSYALYDTHTLSLNHWNQ